MTVQTGLLPASPSSAPFPSRQTQCFSVITATDPSALPRVLEIFAKLTRIPDQCHSTRAGRDGEEMHIDLQFSDMDMPTAEHLARALRGMHLVSSVLTSEKRQRLSA